MDWLQLVLVFLDEYSAELGATAVIGGGAAWLLNKFKKDKGTDLSKETIAQIKPQEVKTSATLEVHEFIAIRREMKADLEQELSQALENEKAQLQARIAEMEAQINDPEPALKAAEEKIADLTARLERIGNDVGGDRLAEAQAAFAKLDYSVADEIFAEVEERQKLEVEQAARAAFGRGEVAEADIRWHDAAAHYQRAERLDPSFDMLRKASDLSERAGDYEAAHRLSEELVAHARSGEEQEKLASAFNEHAINARQLGRFDEAEGLHREALMIDEKTIGTEHPSYATCLNNLAGVVEAQGRFEEAEGLYREALAIGEKTIGTEHPSYAIRLNNLAGVVQAQGRFEEAEGLYREALAIGEKTIGTEHPDYAVRLNNLAGVVQAQGRFEEAEGLHREALMIDEKTIGTEHPSYATHLNNLARAVEAQGRLEEAEPLYREAIQIAFDSLGAEHPNTITFQANLDKLLAQKP